MHKLSFLIAILVILASCSKQTSYNTGEIYHGFTLVDKHFVDEVNAECLLFRHEKSGAHLLKIAADDDNKLFNIAFKTLPETDYGTPHIMEHSVLNGSKNFPVKSPFDVLMKGSLKTFLNAMTGSDITTYPVASMNEKDYFNLMHVYLDAVLNPMIYEDPRILKQEGWHYELDDKDAELSYKGVVYNEMKGVYSNPESELYYQISKNLYADNTYGVESGGYPTAIPKLTYDYFINFHKKYYHPGNSYILLYGDADLDKELAFIDSAYLSNYDLPSEEVTIKLQEPFDSLKEAEAYYPLPEGAQVEDQTFLNLSFVLGSSSDRKHCMMFDVIAEALVNNESAPVRLALQEKGIGRDVDAMFLDSRQSPFMITVKNANPEDKELFRETVFKAIQDVVDNGFDKEMLEGIINRTEFNLKEDNDAQKGLTYIWHSYRGWFYDNDPFLGLEFNEPLAEIKKAMETNEYEEALQKYLLDNTHALLLVLKPEPGLQAKIDAETREELKDYKASLSDEEVDQLVADTEALVEYQQQEDSPEALETIPSLQLSDISPKSEWLAVDQRAVSDVNVLHYNEFTNNIVYNNLYFDMRSLPTDLIPYARLLSSLMGKLDTEHYSFGELDKAFNINTGGFYTYLSYFLENKNDDQLIPKFVVSGKATAEKADKLFELTSDAMLHTRYEDKDRLKELISRQHAAIDSDIRSNGLNYAAARLGSYYSNFGMVRELTTGLEYYNFLTDLFENFDSDSDEIIAKLQQTASLLFNKQNLVAATTCDDKDFTSYSEGLNSLLSQLSDEDPNLKDWNFDFSIKNEGLESASKVQYVLKGYNFKKLGYDYNGKMRVLNQILSTDWLQTQIRVVGGAYGGWCNISSTGDVYFASYRDPNLKETIENYDKTPDYLSDLAIDSTEMTRYIIGTISRMDFPQTASQKGNRAFQYYFEKTTPEELQAERQAVLSTTVDDIKGMQQMIKDVLDQNAFCVYGNEEKLEANADVFNKLLRVTN